MVVKATIHQPDAIYFDPRATRFTCNSDAWVVVHVAADPTGGAYGGNLINVGSQTWLGRVHTKLPAAPVSRSLRAQRGISSAR